MPIIMILAALLLLGAGCQKPQQNIENSAASPATPGQIELSSALLSFGEIPVGSEANDQAIQIKNIGGSPVRVINVTVDGDFTADSLCPDPLSANETCYLIVGFTPTHSGDYNNSLIITTDSEMPEKILPLSGRGLLGSLYVSPRSLLTTTVAPDEEKHVVVTIKNIGSHTVKKLGIKLPEKPFTLSSTCSSELKAGQTCFVTVSFKSEVAGEFTSAITVTAEHEKIVSISLKGVATDPALSVIDATSEQTSPNR